MRGRFFDSGWFSCRIEKEHVRRKSTEKDLTLIEETVGKYKIYSKNWQEFRKYKRESDEYFFYEKPDKDRDANGVVMLRDGVPVLGFYLHKYLYNKVRRMEQ